jgi:hypothetical protein
VQYAEGHWTPPGGTDGAYLDAVGDLAQLADPIVSAKWGPSCSGFQIRTLRDPLAWGAADRWRNAALLHDDPEYAAQAAYVISKGGTDWSLWSTFADKNYLPYKGKDYELRRGHPRAADWSK